MNISIKLLLSLFILFSATSCTQIGGGDSRLGPQADAQGINGERPDPAEIDGRMLYHRLEDYTCTPPTGGAPIPSYKNSILVKNNGERFSAGDRCTPTLIPIRDQVDESSIKRILGYGPGIYEEGEDFSKSIIKTWCVYVDKEGKRVNEGTEWVFRANQTMELIQAGESLTTELPYVVSEKNGILSHRYQFSILGHETWISLHIIANKPSRWDPNQFDGSTDPLFGTLWQKKVPNLLCRVVTPDTN